MARDLGSLRAKEQFQQAEVRRLEEKIVELEEVIKRQARTIKVQSEQIAAPKEVNRTPHRGATTPAAALEYRQQVYAQPAPVYRGQTVQSGNISLQANAPPSSFTIPTPAPQLNSFIAQSTSSAVVIQGDEIPQVNWAEEFSEFFDLTLAFCRTFANVPNDKRDQALNGNVLSELQRASHAAAVQDLLGSSDTRYFLVSTVINHAICEDIFRSALVKGYSTESDNKIGEIRRAIKPNTQVSIKRGLVKAAADTLNAMRKEPGLQEWIEVQIGIKASAMWDLLENLLAPEADRQLAFDDLTHVFKEGYRIGLLMYSVPMTWSMNFPQNARGSFFNPTTMINKDEQFREDPVTLRNQRLRVRLGMTPTIVALNFMEESMMPRTMHFAQVLLQN